MIKEIMKCISCETIQDEQKECYFCGGELKILYDPFKGEHIEELKKRWDKRADNSAGPVNYSYYSDFNEFIRDMDPEIHYREIHEIKQFLEKWNENEKEHYGVGCGVTEAILSTEVDLHTLVLFEGVKWWYEN